MLEQQQRERDDKHTERKCLFCRERYVGDRHQLFLVRPVVHPVSRLTPQHMLHEHRFNVGRPDNLVYIDELLAVLHVSVV